MATGDSVQLQSVAKPKNSPTTKRRTLEQQQQLWGWLFLSPWIIGFLAFTAFPIIFSFGLTFTDYTLANPDAAKFIGLANWQKLFTDPLARTALGVTIKFALFAVPFGILVPLAMAALLNSKYLLGKRLWRTLFYMPYMVPAVSGIFIWTSFFNGQSGWLNRILRMVGVADPPNWFQDERWILFALLIMGVWGVGNSMLTMLATMQGVPTELYEASDVDGAGPWTKFKSITLPMISPVIFYNLVLSVIGVMQIFVVPYIVTRGSGDPNKSAYFFNMHLYKTAFAFFDMGYGATQAWLIFLVALGLTLFLFTTARRWVYYAGGE
jgi:multiple sugar transport system permease protein